MHWLLFFLLIILLLFIYYLTGKDALNPSVISICVFLVSSLIFALNADYWKIKLNIFTIMIIITALFAFCFGGLIRINIKKTNTYYNEIYYKIPKFAIFLFFIFNVISLILIYRRFMSIANIYSKSSYMFANVRSALASGEISWGTSISILRESMYTIGYVCIYIFIINIMTNRDSIKDNLYLLLPVVPMLLAMSLSTGRTGYIRVIVLTITIGTMIYSYKKKIYIGKFAKIAILALIIFLIIFIKLGKATGKSQIFSYKDTISIYTGSSIGALNQYLKNPISYSKSFGGETLYGLRNIFRLFNSSVIVTPIPLPFSYAAHGQNTNVYTAFRRYINDFGYIGLYSIQFLKGILFGNWYYNLKKNKEKGISLLFYGYFVYDIFMQSIEENFLRELFTTAQLFVVISFIIIYKFFIKPYKFETKKQGDKI